MSRFGPAETMNLKTIKCRPSPIRRAIIPDEFCDFMSALYLQVSFAQRARCRPYLLWNFL
jgi:hypothetical protein